MSNPAISMFELHQSNTSPTYQVTLTHMSGNVVNLTTATSVTFSMANAATGTVVLSQAATIVNAAQGLVSYTWGSNDTLKSGMFMANWKVTWSGGSTTSYPLYGYDYITVVAKLA
jgi:hypothetical protein